MHYVKQILDLIAISIHFMFKTVNRTVKPHMFGKGTKVE